MTQYVVQGQYDHLGTWHDVSVSTRAGTALDDLEAYQENEPEYDHRLIIRTDKGDYIAEMTEHE